MVPVIVGISSSDITRIKRLFCADMPVSQKRQWTAKQLIAFTASTRFRRKSAVDQRALREGFPYIKSPRNGRTSPLRTKTKLSQHSACIERLHVGQLPHILDESL